jgi:hypothetical protein
MAKADDLRELADILHRLTISKLDCYHNFKIVPKSGTNTGFALWRCTKCPKVVQSS